MSKTILEQVEEAFHRDADEAEEAVLTAFRKHLKEHPVTVQNAEPEWMRKLNAKLPRGKTQLGLPGIRDDKPAVPARRRGRGRGNWGHKGRPGQRGGSADRDMAYEQGGTMIVPRGGHDPDSRFDEYKRRAGIDPNITVGGFARDTWEFTDTDSGMYTEIENVTMERIGRTGVEKDVIEINGKVFTPDGSTVGEFQRTLNVRTGEVHNDLFDLRREFQGGGFGGKFYAHAEGNLLSYGAKKITTFANLSIGSYAWARMGFDWEHPYDGESMSIGVRDLWKESYKDVRFPYRKKVLKPWEIAALTGPDGTQIGKAYLLDGRVVNDEKRGKSWDAVKFLNPDSTGFKVGEAYYRAKGYK